MGRAVNLWKSNETDAAVEYRYGPDRSHTGRLCINKLSGAVTGEEPVPGITSDESWFLYGMLAKAKAEKMFRSQAYPDEAYMAT
jgi:hypothetical protein